MRIFTEGFETGQTSMSGWGFFNTYITQTQGVARKDINGNGGDWFIRCSVAAGAGARSFMAREPEICRIKNIRPTEFWYRCGAYMPNPYQRISVGFKNFLNQFQISLNVANTGLLSLYRENSWTGSSTLLATSTQTLPTDQWILLEVHAYIHNTDGFIKAYINGDTSPIVEVSGVNTQPHSERGLSLLDLGPSSGGMDDLAINAITMLYDGGTGSAPVVGNTITGGTSGATAVITAVEGDATSGRLWLENVDIDPNPFQDNEIISGSGFSASVNAPNADFLYGFEPQSWRPGDGYIIGMRPNGDDSIQLDGSDGDQINNYLLIDDPANSLNTGDYVSTATSGNQDLYDIESFSDLGFSLGQVAGVNAVSVRTFSRRSGNTINDIELAVSSGATTDYSDRINLDLNFSIRGWEWGYNPDDNENWSEADINALIAGIRFQS